MNRGIKTEVNLVKDLTVTIDKVDSKKAHFLSINAWQKEGLLQIAGKLELHRKIFKGHIDIAIIASDGSIIHKSSFLPESSAGDSSYSGELLWGIDIPLILPRGSKIRVAVHKTEPDDIPRHGFSIFHCDNNRAIPKNALNELGIIT